MHSGIRFEDVIGFIYSCAVFMENDQVMNGSIVLVFEKTKVIAY
jgi:hypothetical protein